MMNLTIRLFMFLEYLAGGMWRIFELLSWKAIANQCLMNELFQMELEREIWLV